MAYLQLASKPRRVKHVTGSESLRCTGVSMNAALLQEVEPELPVAPGLLCRNFLVDFMEAYLRVHCAKVIVCPVDVELSSVMTTCLLDFRSQDHKRTPCMKLYVLVSLQHSFVIVANDYMLGTCSDNVSLGQNLDPRDPELSFPPSCMSPHVP